MRILLLLVALFSMSAFAGEKEEQALKNIEEKFKATFTNMPTVSFEPGPFEGLYEMNINGKIIYYHAEKELLIFGEIYDKFGKSLTADKLALAAQQKIAKLPLSEALVIGPKDGIPIVEFTDPDCTYCRAYNDYITKRPNTKVKRVIFFFTRIHPDAAKKAEHILCASDKQAAFNEVFSGKELSWKGCEEGKRQLAVHQKASSEVGLGGTPSFSLDGALITGFKRTAIEDYLNRKSQL